MNFRQPVEDQSSSPYIFTEGEINFEYPVHLDPFEGLPPSTQLLYITEFDGKTLVGVPQSAWSRLVSKRAMPATCLTKASLLEVLACRMSARTTPESEEKIKLWVGFLKPEFIQYVHTFIEDFKCDHFFDDDMADPLLPFAQSLIDAAQEHFAFFSAAEEQEVPDGDLGEQDEQELIADSGYPKSLLKRVEKLEGTMLSVSEGIQELLGREKAPIPFNFTADAGKKTLAKKAPVKKPVAMGNPKPKPGSKYPLLDPGVVEAAIQAGVPESNLVEMQRLIGSNAKAAKVKDLNTRVIIDPLSEEEDGAAAAAQAAEGFGLEEEPQDPVHNALHKLTAIMEVLTLEKKKKTPTSRLDTALDNLGPAGSESYSVGAGKKSSAARRMLRSVYQEHPEEISAVVERLIYEDLSSQTLGPGQTAQGLNARAWVEFRSRIGNYKTSAHSSWAAAGILDSLIAGDVSRARARCALLLLQLDQASVDRGSWGLASELSLEGLPPYSALAAHTSPLVSEGEQPFSKILDPRWAEICLAYLKEQDDYLLRRKNIGRMTNPNPKLKDQDEDAEVEKRRRAKAKAKAKSAGASSQQDA